MLIETVVVGAFQCNCTIIACEETKEAVVIDPGDEPEKILEIIKHYDLKVKYLLHTHAHLDHIMGTRKVKEATQAEILLHRDDNDIYENLIMQASLFGFNVQEPLKVDKFLGDSETVSAGNTVNTKVIHTPGHSPGSICFHFDKEKVPLLFSGDTLFARSIGRTDLWGASHPQLLKSIESRIFSLEEETVVCPGHGPRTSVWEEKKKNPFFK
jgi:hydroxyacylglutathione hydrolase